MGSKRLIWILFPAILAISLLSLVFGAIYFHSVFNLRTIEYHQSTLTQKSKINHLEMELFLKDSNVSLCDFTPSTNVNFSVFSKTEPSCNIEKWPQKLEAFKLSSQDTLIEFNTKGWYSIYTLRKGDQKLRILLELNEKLIPPDFLGREFFNRYAMPGFFALLIVAFAFSRWMTSPLEDLEEGALRFSTGDLKQPLAPSPIFELNSLSTSLNLMADEINEKMSHLFLQSNELKSVLASMSEGVIALDLEFNILNMNKSAKNLLNVEPIKKLLRENFVTHFPNSELINVTQRVITDQQYVRGDMKLKEQATKIIEYRATPLQNVNGKHIGVLIVLTDVSRLRHLENVRSDFVANVSHELRTPITSIQGYTEMLIDGVPPEQGPKFLEVVHRQTLRLMDIITDLTELAKLDQLEGVGQLEKKMTSLTELLNRSRQSCEVLAEKKSITVDIEISKPIDIFINANLMEQAIVNILSNAIKYSDAKKRVLIESKVIGKSLSISLIDQGFGIPNSHLDRIFERFYRVDKARSKELGGTGLGLAIVNHIARAHGGYIEVSSQVGIGSRFTINLPIISNS